MLLWDLLTIWDLKTACYTEVHTILAHFIHIAIYLDPHKQSVIERFPLLGKFVIRGFTEYIYFSKKYGRGPDAWAAMFFRIIPTI